MKKSNALVPVIIAFVLGVVLTSFYFKQTLASKNEEIKAQAYIIDHFAPKDIDSYLAGLPKQIELYQAILKDPEKFKASIEKTRSANPSNSELGALASPRIGQVICINAYYGNAHELWYWGTYDGWTGYIFVGVVSGRCDGVYPVQER